MSDVLFITTLLALRLCNGRFDELSGYFKIDTPLSASDAQFACAAYGSSLATVTTEDDNNIVSALCDANSDDVCWIGLNNQEREGVFEWNDGLNIAPFDVTQSWILWENSSYHGRWISENSSYHGRWGGCVSTSDGYWEFDDCRSDRYPLCNNPPICALDECMAGPPGPTGPQGPRGLTGLQGPIGNDGTQGRPGLDGTDGGRGSQGGPGEQGEQGAKGLQGLRGPKGDEGPQGPPGNVGTDGGEGSAGAKGDTGQKGATGIQGIQGQQGAPGPPGPPGDPGQRGSTGSQGELGERGYTGEKGQEGSKGNPGSRGLTGQQGPEGGKGNRGKRGPAGLPGRIYILYNSYVAVPQYKTYDAANAYCMSAYGTSLAVVRSAEEYNNAREVCNSIGMASGNPGSCYIGSNAYQYVDDILTDCVSGANCGTNSRYFVCLLPTPSKAGGATASDIGLFNDHILHRLIVGLCLGFVIISVVMVYAVCEINTIPRKKKYMKVDVAGF